MNRYQLGQYVKVPMPLVDIIHEYASGPNEVRMITVPFNYLLMFGKHVTNWPGCIDGNITVPWYDYIFATYEKRAHALQYYALVFFKDSAPNRTPEEWLEWILRRDRSQGTIGRND